MYFNSYLNQPVNNYQANNGYQQQPNNIIPPNILFQQPPQPANMFAYPTKL